MHDIYNILYHKLTVHVGNICVFLIFLQRFESQRKVLEAVGSHVTQYEARLLAVNTKFLQCKGMLMGCLPITLFSYFDNSQLYHIQGLLFCVLYVYTTRKNLLLLFISYNKIFQCFIFVNTVWFY